MDGPSRVPHDEPCRSARPADVPLLMARFRRPGPGPSVPGEWRHRTKRGAHVWVEVSAQSIEYEGRRAGLAVARDVTDRHVAEEALVE